MSWPGWAREWRALRATCATPRRSPSAVAAAAPEVVIHLAAQSLVRRSFAEPRETFDINVMGTVNVLDAVRRHGDGVRALVNVTSDKCYENREWEWGYREDEPMGGHDPYSNSKGCCRAGDRRIPPLLLLGRDGHGSPRAAPVTSSAEVTGARIGSCRTSSGLRWPASRCACATPTRSVPGSTCSTRSAATSCSPKRCGTRPSTRRGGTSDPTDDEARPVGWIVERMSELWPTELRWAFDDGPHPHEARYLKVDSSRARVRLGWRPLVGLDAALASIVAWHQALREGSDMRAVTLGQVEAFQTTRPHRHEPDGMSILWGSRRSGVRGPRNVAAGELVSAAAASEQHGALLSAARACVRAVSSGAA